MLAEMLEERGATGRLLQEFDNTKRVVERLQNAIHKDKMLGVGVAGRKKTSAMGAVYILCF